MILSLSNLTINGRPVGLFEETQALSFKRYMWRWDETLGNSAFQMSRIQIDDVALPYTYITYGKTSGRDIGAQPASNMVEDVSTATDPNSKWCLESARNASAWIIFELPAIHTPQQYRLMTAGDTGSYTNRNPLRIRLYGTNEETTDADDPSWVLLSDETNENNSIIPGQSSTWSDYIVCEEVQGYNRFKILATGTINETGDPSRYCQWGQIGLGWNNNNPVYGFDYYNVESYQLVNGTYWADYLDINYPLSNWFRGSNSYKCDYTYNVGHKDDCYAEVIFTTNESITPTSIGLISTDNAQRYPQRPEHFYLYGWNGSDWVLITDVLGANTTAGNSVETIVNI